MSEKYSWITLVPIFAGIIAAMAYGFLAEFDVRAEYRRYFKSH